MRKKWTVKTEVNQALVKFREKRKWQIALRRYVLEKNKSSYYAPYFGLDISKFRQWIELQFEGGMEWENFSTAWQFDHIVPVAYFDFSDEADLFLCWNFTNIRVEKVEQNKNRGNRVDVLAAKSFFEALHKATGYDVCGRMVEKIIRIEVSQIASNSDLEDFIVENKSYLETVAGFSSYEFDKLNTGTDLKSVLFEKNFLKKFGG
jgi:hypothetical protein